MSYADRDKYGMYKESNSAGPGPALMGAETLLGDKVVNTYDLELGEIKEIMLDMQTGQVAYAVLAFGSVLGMGGKLFAIPWQALHLDTANRRFVLNVDRDRLKTAPGFNKDAWPNMADIQWAQEIHTFYGTDPRRAGAPSMGPGANPSAHGSGMGGTADVAHGDGASPDPRAGNTGGDTDLSRIRGSNIG
jgi:sporulation protein YlmC with PRC-barrel domain